MFQMGARGEEPNAKNGVWRLVLSQPCHRHTAKGGVSRSNPFLFVCVCLFVCFVFHLQKSVTFCRESIRCSHKKWAHYPHRTYAMKSVGRLKTKLSDCRLPVWKYVMLSAWIWSMSNKKQGRLPLWKYTVNSGELNQETKKPTTKKHKRLKWTLFNWTKQDNMCEISRKFSFLFRKLAVNSVSDELSQGM